jgi:hypothetical protein
MNANPATAALSRAVNRAIANGAPVYKNMPDLNALRAAADRADAALDEACRPHYCDGRWGAYRAIEAGQDVPAAVMAAMDIAHAARHEFYSARDGEGGFLGSRGL